MNPSHVVLSFCFAFVKLDGLANFDEILGVEVKMFRPDFFIIVIRNHIAILFLSFHTKCHFGVRDHKDQCDYYGCNLLFALTHRPHVIQCHII